MAESTPQSRTVTYLEFPELGQFTEQEVNILRKVNQKIAAAENIEQTLRYLFEATREVCQCDRVSIAFLDEDRRRVTSHTVIADYEPLLLNEGYSEDLDGSSLEHVINAGRCRIIDDLQEYGMEHPDSRSTRLLMEEGVRSSMTCPLKVEGRVVGILFRSSKQPHTFDTHQIRLHLAVAERLGQAVEKAYRIDRLARANEAYMELLGFVTHELKGPVANLVMTSELLLDGQWGELGEEVRNKIQRIEYNGQYLLLLIRDYLNLARLESGTMQINPADDVDFAKQVLTPSCEMIQPWLEGKEMTLTRDLDDDLTGVQCDSELMSIAMTNLLNNAAKYGRKGGEIRLSAQRNDDGLVVTVWNEGAGFRKDQQQKLFRKFSRLNDPNHPKAKGTGVGLYTVWRIVTGHGGKITARSEYGQWAEFTVTLPQPLPKKVTDG